VSARLSLDRPRLSRLAGLGRQRAGAGGRSGTALGAGLVMLYASVLILVPVAAVAAKAFSTGSGAFWQAVSQPETVAALRLTLLTSLAVVAINAVAGTVLAWLLVRDRFPGKGLVSAIIDLPFALPTVVAGLTLLSLYGKDSPLGLDVAYTRAAIIFALAFVTLPFSVRAIQPVLAEMDRTVEEAAASLGAGPLTVFRRIILPALGPAILTGAGLGFARAVGEYGSVVLISGNLPFKTEVASVRIFGLVQSGALPDAAAVSVVLLAVSLLTLLVLSWLRYRYVVAEAGQ
jgi:sulfate/thiosulfate transport system permease protein